MTSYEIHPTEPTFSRNTAAGFSSLASIFRPLPMQGRRLEEGLDKPAISDVAVRFLSEDSADSSWRLAAGGDVQGRMRAIATL